MSSASRSWTALVRPAVPEPGRLPDGGFGEQVELVVEEDAAALLAGLALQRQRDHHRGSAARRFCQQRRGELPGLRGGDRFGERRPPYPRLRAPCERRAWPRGRRRCLSTVSSRLCCLGPRLRSARGRLRVGMGASVSTSMDGPRWWWFVLAFGYWIVCERLVVRRRGKRISSLRVETANGGRPSWGSPRVATCGWLVDDFRICSPTRPDGRSAASSESVLVMLWARVTTAATGIAVTRTCDTTADAPKPVQLSVAAPATRKDVDDVVHEDLALVRGAALAEAPVDVRARARSHSTDVAVFWVSICSFATSTYEPAGRSGSRPPSGSGERYGVLEVVV